jgi:hypothetical protein
MEDLELFSQWKYARLLAGVLFALAALMAADGIPLPIARRPALAIALFGGVLIVGFGENILPLYLVFPKDWLQDYQPPVGMAARLWGIIFVSLGFILAIGGLVAWISPGWLERYMLESPNGQGLVVAIAGMLVLARGLLFALDPGLGGSGLRRILALLPGRVWGIILVLLGVVLMAAGWLRIVAPELTSQFIHGLIPPFPTPPLP